MGMPGEGAGGHKTPGLEVFATSGFFAVTGQRLPTATDKLADGDAAERGWAAIRQLGLGAERPVSESVGPDLIHRGLLDDADLDCLLAALRTEDFRDHDRWFRLMCSCWFLTDGRGADVFAKWSTSDPQYAGHGRKVRERWRSLAKRTRSEVTGSTLVHFLLEAGAQREAEALIRALDRADEEAIAAAQNGRDHISEAIHGHH